MLNLCHRMSLQFRLFRRLLLSNLWGLSTLRLLFCMPPTVFWVTLEYCPFLDFSPQIRVGRGDWKSLLFLSRSLVVHGNGRGLYLEDPVSTGFCS